MTKQSGLNETKRLMGALVRMKPKPHEEMRLKSKVKKAKSPRQKRRDASAKPKTA